MGERANAISDVGPTPFPGPQWTLPEEETMILLLRKFLSYLYFFDLLAVF